MTGDRNLSLVACPSMEGLHQRPAWVYFGRHGMAMQILVDLHSAWKSLGPNLKQCGPKGEGHF